MKFKGTYLSLFILLILILTVIITEHSLKKREELLFPELDIKEISRIKIKIKNEEVVLKKRDNFWLVESSDNYKADQEKIEEILKKIKGFKRNNLVSKNPKKRSFYGLDKEYIEVALFDPKEKIKASFNIGKSGPDFYSTYIQRKGEREVYLINEYLRSSFERESKLWRDFTIFNFNPQEVEELTLKKDKEKVVIVKEKEKYIIKSPEKTEAKEKIVRSILDEISNLKADDFYLGEDKKITGLEKANSFIKLKFKDREEKLLVGEEDKEGQYYLKKDKENTIFLVSKYKLSDIFREFKDLKKEKKTK